MSKTRVEREIEEILSKYEEEKGALAAPPKPQREERQIVDFRTARNLPPRNPGYNRHARSSGGGFSMPDLKSLSAGQYMLTAFGVAALAVIISPFVPVLPTILIILAVVLFLAPIVLYHNSGTTSGGWSPTGEEKRWRGQPIDIRDRSRRNPADPLDGVKRFFRRK